MFQLVNWRFSNVLLVGLKKSYPSIKYIASLGKTLIDGYSFEESIEIIAYFPGYSMKSVYLYVFLIAENNSEDPAALQEYGVTRRG